MAAPLIQPALLRESALRLGCAANALVSTVMMATLVVGPFYLAGALGLDAGGTGLAMSAGPVAAALAGMPAGRLADRHGAGRMACWGWPRWRRAAPCWRWRRRRWAWSAISRRCWC